MVTVRKDFSESNHLSVGGSQLTDATCAYMTDPGKVPLLRSQFMSLLSRYMVQAQIVHRTKVPKGDAVEVLDVGCANGAAASLYASQSFESQGRKPIHYTGIDLYQPALDEARSILNESPSRLRKVNLVHHDLTNPWPFKDNMFDVLWYTEVIEHVPMHTASFTLVEAYRVCKPGGVMLLSTPAPLDDSLVWPDSHDHEFTREEMRGLLTSTGWNINDIWGTNVNWMTARKRLREHYPGWFDIYEKLRLRAGTTIAQVALQALIPDITDDLAWKCIKPKQE